MSGRAKSDKRLTREERWRREDAELEAFCRWPDADGPMYVLQSDPVDPWQIAIQEAYGMRRFLNEDDY